MKHKRQTHTKDNHGKQNTAVVDGGGAQSDEDASICGLVHGRLGVVEAENSFQNNMSTVSGQPCIENDMQTFEMFSNSFMERSLKDIPMQPPTTLDKGTIIIHNRCAAPDNCGSAHVMDAAVQDLNIFSTDSSLCDTALPTLYKSLESPDHIPTGFYFLTDSFTTADLQNANY